MEVLKALAGKDIHDYRGFMHGKGQWYEVDLPWLVATYPELEHDDFVVFLRHKERLSEGAEHIFIENPRLNLKCAIAEGNLAPLPTDYIKNRAFFWVADSYLQSGDCVIHPDDWTAKDFRAGLSKTILTAEKNIQDLKAIMRKY